MSDVLQQPFGGEIWEQSRFPYMTRYIVTGSFGMALSSDPREQGNTLCNMKDGKEAWTQETLAIHLDELDYVCCGQLRDILLDDNTGEHFAELAKEGFKERWNTRRWKGYTDK